MSQESEQLITLVINFNDSQVKTKLEVMLSRALFMQAGYYFKALLSQEYKFKESNDKILFIDSNAVDQNLIGDDWKRYFDVIVDKTKMLDLVKSYPLEGFVSIAKYLSNDTILDKFRQCMYGCMETEPLEDYLKDWMTYFRLSETLWPAPMDGKKVLLSHLKYQLMSFVDEYEQLAICWKRMHMAYTSDLVLSLDNYLIFCDVSHKYLMGHWNTLFALNDEYLLHLDSENVVNYATLATNKFLDLSKLNLQHRLKCFSLGILDGIDWHNMILAGGSVNRIIDTRVTAQELTNCPESDLDLFILGDQATQRTKVLDLLMWFQHKYGNKRLYIGANKSVTTIWITGVPRVVQIICANSVISGDAGTNKANNINISTILYRFDLTHIQVAYDGQKFLATPLGVKANVTRVSKGTVKNFSSPMRIFKTYIRGFTMDGESECRFNKAVTPLSEEVPLLTNILTSSKRTDPLFDDNNSVIKKVTDKYRFNYFIPLTQYSMEKNLWELNQRYSYKTIKFYHDIDNGALKDIMSDMVFCSDFLNDYETRFLQSTDSNPSLTQSTKGPIKKPSRRLALGQVNDVNLKFNMPVQNFPIHVRIFPFGVCRDEQNNDCKNVLWDLPPLELVSVAAGHPADPQKKAKIILKMSEEHVNRFIEFEDSIFREYKQFLSENSSSSIMKKEKVFIKELERVLSKTYPASHRFKSRYEPHDRSETAVRGLVFHTLAQNKLNQPNQPNQKDPTYYICLQMDDKTKVSEGLTLDNLAEHKRRYLKINMIVRHAWLMSGSTTTGIHFRAESICLADVAQFIIRNPTIVQFYEDGCTPIRYNNIGADLIDAALSKNNDRMLYILREWLHASDPHIIKAFEACLAKGFWTQAMFLFIKGNITTLENIGSISRHIYRSQLKYLNLFH